MASNTDVVKMKENAGQTDGQTDGRTPNRWITFTATRLRVLVFTLQISRWKFQLGHHLDYLRIFLTGILRHNVRNAMRKPRIVMNYCFMCPIESIYSPLRQIYTCLYVVSRNYMNSARTCASACTAGMMGDSQVSGNRQHRIGSDRSVRLMQYLSIGKLLI